MDKFKLSFLEEAKTLIEDLEKVSLTLGNNTQDMSIIQQIFRIMHTLKGSSAMFGFDKIGEFTHHLETIYDLIREGKISVSKEIMSITFSSVDHLRILLSDIDLSNRDN